MCFPDYLVYFVKISICDTLCLNLMNDDACKVNATELKELEQLKLSPSTKSATADKFITKKHKKKAVPNVEITVTK